MLRTIRKRLTYTNVAMTLALVFAMSGGAYAAGKYLITSTKQISPKVLKALVGKSGHPGSQGQTGAAGIPGPAGPAGKDGAVGPQGPQGPIGPAGKNGENGKDGTTGFTETLPSGKTETGAWGFSTTSKTYLFVPISFPIPLKQPLTESQVHYIAANGMELVNNNSPSNGVHQELPSVACQGNVAEPKAEPGNLCVYEHLTAGISLDKLDNNASVEAPNMEIFPPNAFPILFGGEIGAAISGADLFFAAREPEQLGLGTWAVTAE